MIIPALLKKGDTIAITATARKISETEITFTINWLQNQGYKVLLGNSIGLEYHQFAGTDAQRSDDFQQLWDNPKVKAIWCARGGYGTVRIIDTINFNSKKSISKWVIGYSDITVLHAHLHTLGIATIHAPMPIDFEKSSAEAKKSLVQQLSSTSYTNSFSNQKNNRLGKTKGYCIGGNLSVLYSLCGSKSAINTVGKILFLEDLDEYYYHIDRMLQNLARNGVFKHLSGLVIGSMNSMRDNTIPFGFSIEQLILELTKNYNYPIAFNAPLGHIKDNRAVIFGKIHTLEVTNENSILTS